MTCDAKFGWSFTDYSFLCGQQYRFGQPSLWSFEFQYDKFSKSCTRQTHYYGIGANYSYNDNQSELGIKYMWNPTFLKIMVSRSTKFYPYLFGQGNFIQTKSQDQISTENKQINSYSLKPGLGLTGNFRDYKVLSIRTYLQIGYNISYDFPQNFKNSLTLEFKMGFGINARQIKRNKQIDTETEQTETK